MLTQVIDQMGRTCAFQFPPQRIVSLVPSQTELLYSLGLDKEIVGITKFCVHPQPWLKQKQLIGGTKNFHFETIEALRPDLVLGNKEENYKEGIDRLTEKYPVWMSDIATLQDSFEMIRAVARLVNKMKEAEALIVSIEREFAKLARVAPKRVLYLIWRDPWMSVGPDTFIDFMLSKIGFVNCMKERRYPVLDDAAIRKLNPELIFLSSEPYPFKEIHREELQPLVPDARILRVDGEMFSWYGSRLEKAPAYFQSLFI